MIGTLVSYPLCLLGDLERFADFVGRGCPAQAGHRMNINATGEAHACVHEAKPYGNIFDIGLRQAWRNLREWHEGRHRNKGCAQCEYEAICHTGCRSTALVYHGRLDGPDPLMAGHKAIKKPYRLVYDPDFLERTKQGARFRVPSTIRFRKEDGFYLLNIRWANTITVETPVGEFLKRQQADSADFVLEDFGGERLDTLAKLFFKDALTSLDFDYKDKRSLLGLSVDISSLK